VPINSWFSGLGRQQIERLTRDSRTESILRHNYLFREHDTSDAIFAIEKGELIIERTARNGDRQVTTLLFPGHLVGFSNGSHYAYGVVAVTKCEVRIISRSLLDSVVKESARESAEFVDNRLRRLGEIILEQSDHLFALCKRQAHERVCCFLCELNWKQKNGRGKTVNIHLSRQDIADYLGLTSETVTRALSKLKNERIIGIDNPHEIKLLQPETIRRLAGDI
jgi:CRP/FNR family transcriptional regulator